MEERQPLSGCVWLAILVLIVPMFGMGIAGMLAPANGWAQTIGMLMFPISLIAGLTAWNIGGLIALIIGGLARLLRLKPKQHDPAPDDDLPPARWILFPVIAGCGLIAGLLIALFGAADLGRSMAICLAAHLGYAALVYATAPTFHTIETA